VGSGEDREIKTDLDEAELLSAFDPDHSPLVELGQRIGPDALNCVLEVLGGEKRHVPTRENFWAAVQREIRDHEIRARFNGRNVRQLAAEYGLHWRMIYRIVSR
jgi:hypothetical protein